jgi:uncharacterized protein (TIGR02466 family)
MAAMSELRRLAKRARRALGAAKRSLLEPDPVIEAPRAASTLHVNLFPTPLAMRVWEDGPELNALLRESILEHEEKTEGVAKSNRGGWHSETGQLEFCGDAGRRLIAHMHALANEATQRIFAEQNQQMPQLHWTLEAWVNVNRDGAFNEVHTHPGSTWSGTYYVDPGDDSDPPRGARLLLTDPCVARSSTFLKPVVPGKMLVAPRAGLMILFPSYVPHMVFPHSGEGARISIAFNLRKEPYP